MRNGRTRVIDWAGAARPPPGVPPLCVTPAALQTLLDTIAAIPPEAGALGFGPAERFGVDMFEFDERGTALASSAAYSPDVSWCNERIQHHLSASALRLWFALAHTHPDGFTRLSAKVGRGTGDLGYLQEVFASCEWVKWFAAPILVGAGTRAVTLHPWMCERTPHGIMVHLTEFRVCDSREFPETEFNAGWQPEVAPRTPAPPPRPRPTFAFDAFALARALRRPVQVRWTLGGPAVAVRDGEVEARILLPSEFPSQPPTVSVALGDTAVPLRFRWRSESDLSPEQRIARLSRFALRVGAEEF